MFLVSTHKGDQAVGIPNVRDVQTNSFSFRNEILTRERILTLDILWGCYIFFLLKNYIAVSNENSRVHVFFKM